MDAAIERHRTVDNPTSLNKSSGLIFIQFIIIMIIDFFLYTFKTFYEYAQQYYKTDNVCMMLYLFYFKVLIKNFVNMFNIFICTSTTTTDMKETTISFQNNVSSTPTSNILLENKTGMFLYILSVAIQYKNRYIFKQLLDLYNSSKINRLFSSYSL